MTRSLPDASDDSRHIRSDVPWEAFEHLLAETRSNSALRFAYDRGSLEIARFSARQASALHALVLIVNLAVEELHVPCRALGSSACVCRERQQGVEPDASFYLRRLPRTHANPTIDLPTHRPPDLIIDTSAIPRSSTRTSLCATFGVSEVWRYDEATDDVAILRLRHGAYREKRESAALVPLTRDVLTGLVREHRATASHAWPPALRSWLREYD